MNIQEQIKRKGIIIVYGSPASGKSTFAQYLMTIIKQITLIIHIDDIEYYFHNNQSLCIPQQCLTKSSSFLDLISLEPNKNHLFSPEIWKKSRDFVKQNIQKLIGICQILVVEDDFLLKSLRKHYKQYAMNHKIKYLEVYMDTPLQKCIEFNILRGSPVSNNTIKQKYQKLQISGYKLSIDQRNIEQDWIENNFSILQPVNTNQKSQSQPHTLTQIEQTQQSIRKYISQIMAKTKLTHSPKQMKQISHNLSLLKKSFDLKKGFEQFKKLSQKYQ